MTPRKNRKSDCRMCAVDSRRSPKTPNRQRVEAYVSRSAQGAQTVKQKDVTHSMRCGIWLHAGRESTKPQKTRWATGTLWRTVRSRMKEKRTTSLYPTLFSLTERAVYSHGRTIALNVSSAVNKQTVRRVCSSLPNLVEPSQPQRIVVDWEFRKRQQSICDISLVEKSLYFGALLPCAAPGGV